MNITEVLNDLQNNANPSRRKLMLKNGGSEDSIGVNLGYLRKYAPQIKSDPELLNELWLSEVPDAQFLAAMVYAEQPLPRDEFQKLVETSNYIETNDALCLNCALPVAEREALIDCWIESDNALLRRSAWDLILTLILNKEADQMQIHSWLTRIDNGMINETSKAQETMNRALAEVGIHYDEFTDKCMALGEKIGLYKDYKPSKGCESPYAPNWITVLRKKLNKSI